jgi:hypothetical protein
MKKKKPTNVIQISKFEHLRKTYEEYKADYWTKKEQREKAAKRERELEERKDHNERVLRQCRD